MRRLGQKMYQLRLKDCTKDNWLIFLNVPKSLRNVYKLIMLTAFSKMVLFASMVRKLSPQVKLNKFHSQPSLKQGKNWNIQNVGPTVVHSSEKFCFYNMVKSEKDWSNNFWNIRKKEPVTKFYLNLRLLNDVRLILI